MRRLNTAPKKERPALVSEGVRIARIRQAELESLAKTQPARVLNAMMSLDELAALPPEIRAESEIPFNGVAHIDLQWITDVDEDGSFNCTHRNVALVGNNIYPIAGAGYLEPKSPVANLPVSGYLLGGTLLLESGGVRNLEPKEIPVADRFFAAADGEALDPVTGRAGAPEIAAVIGGRVHHFENESVRAHVAEELGAAATTQQGIPEGKFAFIQASGASGMQLIDFDPAPLTTKNPKVLFIRAKFPLTPLDPINIQFPLLGVDPISVGELSASLSNVDGIIRKFSYGDASIDATVSPKTYTLLTSALTVATEPENQQQQTGGSYRIMAEARAAAAADFNLAGFDIVAVYFPNLADLPGSRITYGGLATIGGKNHWINGVGPAVRDDIITHEFGHNYGLNHSNYLDPQRRLGGSYFNQVSLDSGDVFDKMSLVYSPNSPAIPPGNLGEKSFFNPYQTSLVSWMPSSKVMDVTAGGTFRVFRFDHPDATSNPLLALRVPMGGNNYNWVALREAYDQTKQSAYITNEGIVQNTSNLVDATPNSNASAIQDRLDAALPVNRSYRDNAAGVTFTTMAAGGTAPNQFIDVKIDFDTRLELQSTNVLVDESGGNAVLVVNRIFNSTGACSVSYSTTGGTAIPGTDFHGTSGTLSWANGDTSPRSIFIPIRPDSINENTESFTLTLTSATNAVISPQNNISTISILDEGSKVTTFNPPFFNNTVEAMVVLPDGKIIAGGSMFQNVTGHIARFNTDGSEDTTFRIQKGNGFSGAGDPTKVLAIVRQSDGKLVVGGEFRSYNGTACSMISRLNENGTVDTGFCTAIGTGANNRINAIGIESNGKIIIAGDFTTFNGAAAPGIVRLNASGSRDTTTPFTPSFSFTANIPPLIKTILIQSDGKVMIGGQFTLAADGNRFRFGIARLNANATHDATFDPGFGTHLYNSNSTPPSATNAVRLVTSVVRQQDGKYIIGGAFTGYNDQPANYLARVNPDGTRDNTFVPPVITGDFNPVEELVLQPSGRLLVSGRFSTPSGRILGLLPTGVIDPNFDVYGGATGSVLSIVTDSAGKIYFGGNFFGFAGNASRPLVKVTAGSNPYAEWRNSRFTSTQIAAGKTGNEEDFDNDGILNITEMALGLSPTVPDSPNSFAIAAGNLSVQTSGGLQSLQASMQRSADNLGVWLVAQFSSDLTTWLPANPVPGSNATYDVTESSPTRFTVKDKTPSGPGVQRFVRFRAVVPN